LTLVMDAAPTHRRAQVERLLVCPRCRSRLDATDVELRCRNAACGFTGAMADDVVLLGDRTELSFFDDKYQVMAEGNAKGGARCICYDRQGALVESLLRPGTTVLDVGCGPTLPYAKPADTFVIGLDASYESIVANDRVDMRIYGTAAELPFPDRSLDMVLAFYAVHHMTGRTMAENRQMVLRVFRELGRVIKPGGELLVFEVSPWAPFAVAERLVWNTARTVLGRKLDMYFYSARAYGELGRVALPGARFSMQSFPTSMLAFFPPAFSLPWLKVPRLMYPMDANLYRWQF